MHPGKYSPGYPASRFRLRGASDGYGHGPLPGRYRYRLRAAGEPPGHGGDDRAAQFAAQAAASLPTLEGKQAAWDSVFGSDALPNTIVRFTGQNGKVEAFQFISKGFSRIDVNTAESEPRDTLAGQLLEKETLHRPELEGFDAIVPHRLPGIRSRFPRPCRAK